MVWWIHYDISGKPDTQTLTLKPAGGPYIHSIRHFTCFTCYSPSLPGDRASNKNVMIKLLQSKIGISVLLVPQLQNALLKLTLLISRKRRRVWGPESGGRFIVDCDTWSLLGWIIAPQEFLSSRNILVTCREIISYQHACSPSTYI